MHGVGLSVMINPSDGKRILQGLPSTNWEDSWTPLSVSEFASELASTYPDYEIDTSAELKQGGMGAVYRARCKRDGKLVAIKALRPDRVDHSAFLSRFKREIEILKKLRHPNIVEIVDSGETEAGTPFFVMEWLEGQTLAKLLAGPARLTRQRKLDLFAAICKGVEYVHTSGIFHRDLKPQNIMIVDGDDRPVILDFGVAREKAQGRSTATEQHGIPFSYGYIAPELLQDSRLLSARSDVYSLGIVFLEMITGELPVAGHKWPSDYEFTDNMDKVVERATEHLPSNRFETVAVFASEIEKAGGVSLPIARPASTKSPEKPITEIASPYKAGMIDLPFECVTFKILHDQVTAVVGGVDGRIAAIDLRTGEVICHNYVFDEHEATEHRYLDSKYRRNDSFFFLELASVQNCFYTMGRLGYLKTWRFDGSFTLLNTVSLVLGNIDLIRSTIVNQACREKFGFVTKRMRKRHELNEWQLNWISSAKLSMDRSTIAFVVHEVALLLADLAGNLKGEPLYTPSVSGLGYILEKRDELAVFRTHKYLPFSDSMCTVHIPRLGENPAVTSTHDRASKYVRIGDYFFSCEKASQITPKGILRYSSDIQATCLLPASRKLLLARRSAILALDLEVLLIEDPLLAGHSGSVCSIDVTTDQNHLVSMSATSLRIWNLQERTPVGGYPSNEVFIKHNILNEYSGQPLVTRDGALCYQSSTPFSRVIFDLNRKSSQRQMVADESEIVPFGAIGGADSLHLFSTYAEVNTKEDNVDGTVARQVKRFLDWLDGTAGQSKQDNRDCFFRHSQLTSKGAETVASVFLGNRHSRIGAEYNFIDAKGVDIGNGRIGLKLAGHIAIYNTLSKAFEFGPVVISQSPENVGTTLGTWDSYQQLAASPDGLKLFVRGNQKSIKIFSSLNLRRLGEIENSTGGCGLLLPYVDSKHLIFSVYQYLIIANSETGSVVGRLNSDLFHGSNSDMYILLGEGSCLAFTAGRNVELLDLVTGRFLDEPLVSHSDLICGLFLCPDNTNVLTVSTDGTAKFTSIGNRIQKYPDAVMRVLERATSMPHL